MRGRIRKTVYLSLAAMLVCLFFQFSCGKPEGEEVQEGAYRIYYLNKAETALVFTQFKPEADETDTQAVLTELLKQEAEVPAGVDWRAPLQMATVRGCVFEGNQAILSMEPSYKELSATKEVLVRAALVRTITQLPGIESVSMSVGEEPLMDRSGNPIGLMRQDTFVDNEGVEINAYDQVALHLYFADESGTALIETSQTVIYNTNTSMERLVVESLIAGPEGKEIYPTIDPDTRIISVTDTDGVCYVNLTSDFLEAVGNVTPEVTLYSIVNSLAELSNVHRVQFMVNGDSQVLYREMIDLEGSFSRNLDIVR